MMDGSSTILNIKETNEACSLLYVRQSIHSLI